MLSIRKKGLISHCLQSEASFGKSQLLNGSNLANQNKNKKAQKLLYFQNKHYSKSQIFVQKFNFDKPWNPQHFHEFFTPILFYFSREIKVVNS